MEGLRGTLAASLPAAVIAIFALACGNFQAPLSAEAVIFGHLLLLLLALFGASCWRDPLALGRGWRCLPWLLWLLAAFSWWRSPVHRAGTLALLLSPAVVFGAAALARSWRSVAAQRWGLRALALVVLGVVVVAWSGWWQQATARPALPLGHHNLLAAWLVGLLPLVAVGWRESGAWRWLAASACLAATLTLVASRSLSGAAALLAVMAVGWALRSGRRTAWWVTAALLLLLPQLTRLAALWAGADISLAARRAYLLAGWQGFLQRPWLGWGPGSAGWTVALHLRPIPGVHPADQAVADLHSLPLTLLYELGLPAVVLAGAAAVVFVVRRKLAPDRDPALLAGALLGLLALWVAGLGGLPLSVTALVAVGMVLVAAALAATAPAARSNAAGAPVWLGLIYVLLVTALLRPYELAHLAYDRAVLSPQPAARLVALERAYELDAAMPLYGFRLALELEPRRRAARLALAAAGRASGVAALWLTAGRLAAPVDSRRALAAWERACDLAPLGAVAPFRLAAVDPHHPLAVERAARALLASPDLRAAREWQDLEGLVGRAVDRLAGEQGIEQGWRWALYESWLRLIELSPSGAVDEAPRLALAMDGEGAEALSLHLFRRRPWPAELAAIELDPQRLAEARQVAASGLPSTSAALFAPGCRLPTP